MLHADHYEKNKESYYRRIFSTIVDVGRADAFITGEIGYHKALDLCQAGLTVLEAGHAATELPAVSLLAQKVMDLDLHLQVHVSACPCYL